jgi:hypothetical protein
MYTKYLSFQKHRLTNVVKYPADLFLSMSVSLLIIRLDTGEKIQLHNHNVRFEDATKEIVIDSGTETYWIGADRVSYYWIQKEGFEQE